MRTTITVACPEDLIDDANQLAMVLAFGPADALTYKAASWQDEQGNLYACASFLAPPEWIAAAQSTLVRPAWDNPPEGEGYTVNMAGAERAQAALVFWMHSVESPTPPVASPDILTAFGGMNGLDALAAMGLTRVEAGPLP